MRKYGRVVLIDDDAIFNFLNARIITVAAADVKLEVFTRAGNALLYLQTEHHREATNAHCLIFLDINMPELNGWQFLDSFVQMPETFTSFFSVYMLSSSNDPEDILRSKAYNVVKGFISKPLKTAHLEGILI